jgi:hypothetical protein
MHLDTARGRHHDQRHHRPFVPRRRTSMSHRSMPLVAAFACLVLLVAGVLVMPPAVTAGPPIISNVWLTIEGTVFHPPQPCMPSGIGEDVSLYGMAHVLTMVDMATDYVMIFINLADVKGMGLITDMTYLAVGAFKTGVAFPPSPAQASDPTAVEIRAAFDLVQAGACPTIQDGAPVLGTLSFNSDGSLIAEESSLSFGQKPTD